MKTRINFIKWLPVCHVDDVSWEFSRVIPFPAEICRVRNHANGVAHPNGRLVSNHTPSIFMIFLRYLLLFYFHLKMCENHLTAYSISENMKWFVSPVSSARQ